jgi:signal transduction histidine kinase
MNAINFSTILPHLLIRQVRVATATSTAKLESEGPAVHNSTSASVPGDLRAKALNVTNDLERRDLAPLLKLVTWIFQPMAMSKNILLRLEAPEIGLFTLCQEVRIQRVLENLLSNALRAAPANSQITLAARVEDGWLCVWVDDQGPGVPLAQQSTLFDGTEISFGECALGVSEEKHGLVVSKEIIVAHGGELLMYNRTNGGAHFEFRLPAPNGLRHHTGTFTAIGHTSAVKLPPLFAQVA